VVDVKVLIGVLRCGRRCSAMLFFCRSRQAFAPELSPASPALGVREVGPEQRSAAAAAARAGAV